MKRILALVCIFILLLFTGIPMFTSNLLCNDYKVYADTPQISDNELIRAAITVYLNSKGAYLSSSGIQMDAVMSLMQAQIDDFIATGVYVGGTLYDTAALVLDIGLTTSPLTVILRAGAVSFFNQFLQWLIDEGKINTGQNNDELYNGLSLDGNLITIIDSSKAQRLGSLSSTFKYNASDVKLGTYVDQFFGERILALFKQTYPTYDINSNTFVSGNVDYTVTYAQGATYGVRIRSQNTHSSYGSLFDLEGKFWLGREDTLPLYTNVGVLGGAYWIRDTTEAGNILNMGFVTYDTRYDVYYINKGTWVRRSDSIPATVNFNKENFDSTPTTPPSGNDGLSYQPKQDGTGNTYNTYNEYYNDWKEGDTYIYYPSDGGGGGDPTPGGTTPPWDGTEDPGTPGGTLTPGDGGGYNLNFPDLGLPDLDIDWSINGLKDKFPFSIPWDLMAFFAVMNAEPETPEIQATIPLGIWEWDIDWDLHAFDNVARILRNMELIGFCIGLILITRSIIKG